MIHYEVYFDNYRWSVEVFIILSHADPKVLLDAVKQAGGSNKVLESAHANLMEDFNSGFTYSSSKYRRSIMVVNRSSSMEEFIEKSEELLNKYWDPSKHHYQDLHSISTYLTFMYPEKYSIYKPSVAKKASNYLDYDISVNNVKNGVNFIIK